MKSKSEVRVFVSKSMSTSVLCAAAVRAAAARINFCLVWLATAILADWLSCLLSALLLPVARWLIRFCGSAVQQIRRLTLA